MDKENTAESLEKKALDAAFCFFEQHEGIALTVGVNKQVIRLKDAQDGELDNLSDRDKERMADGIKAVAAVAMEIAQIGIEKFESMKKEEQEKALSGVIIQTSSSRYSSLQSSAGGEYLTPSF